MARHIWAGDGKLLASAADWDTVNLQDGLIYIQGRLCELLHPELWQGCAAAWSNALDMQPRDYATGVHNGYIAAGVSQGPQGWRSDSGAGASRIVAPHNAALNFGTGDVCVMAWVFGYSYGTGFDLDGREVLTKALSSGSYAGYTLRQLRVGGTSLWTFQVYNSGGARADGVSSPVAGRWQHVCGGRVGGTIFICVDGEQEAQTANSADGDSSADLLIGGENSGWSGSCFDGLIEDVRIYHRDIRGEQLQRLAGEPNAAYLAKPLKRSFFITANNASGAAWRRLPHAHARQTSGASWSRLVDWGDPVDLRHGLNQGLVSWFMFSHGVGGWGTTVPTDLLHKTRGDAFASSSYMVYSDGVADWTHAPGPGPWSGAWSFNKDVSDSWMRFTAPETTTTEFTFTTWLRPVAPAINYNEIWGSESGGHTLFYSGGVSGVADSGTTVYAMSYYWPPYNDAQYLLDSGVYVKLYEWNFVSFTIKPTGCLLYAWSPTYGRQTYFHSYSLTTASNAAWRFGRVGSLSRLSTGHAAEFRIYNRTLDVDELDAYRDLSYAQGYAGLLNRRSISLATAVQTEFTAVVSAAAAQWSASELTATVTAPESTINGGHCRLVRPRIVTPHASWREVDWSRPVAKDHWLNDGLFAWYLSVHGQRGYGSKTWDDMTGRFDAPIEGPAYHGQYEQPPRDGGWSSIYLNGTSDRGLPTFSGLASSTQQFTVCAWCRPLSVGSYEGVAVTRTNQLAGILYNGAGSYYTYTWEGTEWSISPPGFTVVLNDWTWVAFSASLESGSGVRRMAYWNATNGWQTYSAAGAGAKNVNGTWSIGREPSSTSRSFHGYMDDVRFYQGVNFDHDKLHALMLQSRNYNRDLLTMRPPANIGSISTLVPGQAVVAPAPAEWTAPSVTCDYTLAADVSPASAQWVRASDASFNIQASITGREVAPTSADWDSFDPNDGTIFIDGQLCELLHPELWQGRVGAWNAAMDAHPRSLHGPLQRYQPGFVNGYPKIGPHSWEFAANDLSHFTVGMPSGLFGSQATFEIWLRRRTAVPDIYADTGCWLLTSTLTQSGHYPWTNNTIYDITFLQSRIFYSSPINLATLHHYCVTSEPGTNNWIAYHNGNVSYTTTGPASIYYPTTARFGAAYSGSDYAFSGWFYEFSLYNRALSPTDVRQLAERRNVSYLARTRSRRLAALGWEVVVSTNTVFPVAASWTAPTVVAVATSTHTAAVSPAQAIWRLVPNTLGAASRSGGREALPSSTDMVTLNQRDGTIFVDGRFCELLHPDLWDGRVGAWNSDLDNDVIDYTGIHEKPQASLVTYSRGWGFPKDVSAEWRFNSRAELFGSQATLEMWLQCNEEVPVAPANTGFVYLNGAGISSYYQWTDDRIYLGVFRDARVNSISSLVDVTKLHHICITTDPDQNWQFWQNGQLAAVAGGQASVSLDTYWEVGTNAVHYYFSGKIYEFSLYNRYVTRSEILQLGRQRNASYLARTVGRGGAVAKFNVTVTVSTALVANVAPAAAAWSAVAVAATVSIDETAAVSPAAAAWSAVAVAATVSIAETAAVSPAAAAWSAVAVAATVSIAETAAVSPAAAAWSATALDAGLLVDAAVSPATASWTATALDAGLLIEAAVSPATASWTATALDAGLLIEAAVSPATASWTATALDAAQSGAAGVAPAEASWTAVALAVDLRVAATVSPATASWTAEALDAGLLVDAAVSPATASWAAEALAAGVRADADVAVAAANWAAPAAAADLHVDTAAAPAVVSWSSQPLTTTLRIAAVMAPAAASWSAPVVAASIGDAETAVVAPASSTWTAVALAADVLLEASTDATAASWSAPALTVDIVIDALTSPVSVAWSDAAAAAAPQVQARLAGREVVPTSADWDSFDPNDGTIFIDGQLCELLHPELWRSRLGAWNSALDHRPTDYAGLYTQGDLPFTPQGSPTYDNGWFFPENDYPYFSFNSRGDLFNDEATWEIWLRRVDQTPASADNSGCWNWGSSINPSLYPYNSGVIYDDTFRNARLTLGSSSLRRDVVHHVCIVNKPGAAGWRYYMHGQLFYSTAGSSTIYLGSEVRVGASDRPYERAFAGWVYEFSIYNRALSDTEVQLLAERPNNSYAARTLSRAIATPGGEALEAEVTIAAAVAPVSASWSVEAPSAGISVVADTGTATASWTPTVAAAAFTVEAFVIRARAEWSAPTISLGASLTAVVSPATAAWSATSLDAEEIIAVAAAPVDAAWSAQPVTAALTVSAAATPAAAAWASVSVAANIGDTEVAVAAPTAASWTATVLTAGVTIVADVAAVAASWDAQPAAANYNDVADAEPATASWTAPVIAASEGGAAAISPAVASWAAPAMAANAIVHASMAPASAAWTAQTVTQVALSIQASVAPAAAIWSAQSPQPGFTLAAQLSPAVAIWSAPALESDLQLTAGVTPIATDWSSLTIEASFVLAASVAPPSAAWEPQAASPAITIAADALPATAIWTAVSMFGKSSSRGGGLFDDDVFGALA